PTAAPPSYTLSTRRSSDLAAGKPGVEARAFYAIPVADMLVFSTLIYFAFRNRFNPAAHKRLILIATIALLDESLVRGRIKAVAEDRKSTRLNSSHPISSSS